MDKIRVAFLIDQIVSDQAGTEKQLLETLRRLDRSRFDPLLICLQGSEWIDRNPVPCESVVLDYRGFLKPQFASFLLSFRRLLADRKPQILQTFFEDSIFVAYLGTRGLERAPALLCSRRDIGMGQAVPWYHALFNLALPLVYRDFDFIVTNGRRIVDFIRDSAGVPERKFKIVHNGIETALDPAPAVPPVFQADPQAVWIGIAANLKPVKKIDALIEALALLRDRHGFADFHAVLMGDGPERAALQSQVERLKLKDRVHFEGAVKSVGPYLRKLQIGVLCSEREGFSNAILEYMAYSLPVVATAVGGNTELVDESNGFCVPACDASALAEALARLCKDADLRQRLGQASRRKVETSYSWDRCMGELQDLYTQLARSRNGHS